jgi:hypothetical protein
VKALTVATFLKLVCGDAVGVSVRLSLGNSDGFDLHTDRMNKKYDFSLGTKLFSKSNKSGSNPLGRAKRTTKYRQEACYIT